MEAPATTRAQAVPVLRVGVVGAGDRVRRTYVPVLAALRERAKVVGFTCRSAERGQRVAAETGWAFSPSLRQLVADHRPDVLILAVADAENVAVLAEAISYGVATLAETPLAWTERACRRLVDQAARGRVAVGIAEQFPFLPAERLKRKLIELGVLGAVTSGVNSFATYAYHGIAQIRAYLGEDRVATSASAVEHEFGRTAPVDGAEPPAGARAGDQRWLLGSVKHADGALLVHEASVGSFLGPPRPAGRLLVYGRGGYLVDDQLTVADPTSGALHTAGFLRENLEVEGARRLSSISVVAPGVGKVEWRNPYVAHALDDEQIAVAQHVDGILRAASSGAMPLYSAAQASKDMEVLRALGYSAKLAGFPVGLPLKSFVQRARVALSASNVRRACARVMARLSSRR